jgi:hypothetical protein
MHGDTLLELKNENPTNPDRDTTPLASQTATHHKAIERRRDGQTVAKKGGLVYKKNVVY